MEEIESPFRKRFKLASDEDWEQMLKDFILDYEQICRNTLSVLNSYEEWDKLTRNVLILDKIIEQLQSEGLMGEETPKELGWDRNAAIDILNEVTIIREMDRDDPEFPARLLASKHEICGKMVEIYFELANFYDQLIMKRGMGGMEFRDIAPPEVQELIWTYFAHTQRFHESEYAPEIRGTGRGEGGVVIEGGLTRQALHIVAEKKKALYDLVPLLLSRLFSHLGVLLPLGLSRREVIQQAEIICSITLLESKKKMPYLNIPLSAVTKHRRRPAGEDPDIYRKRMLLEFIRRFKLINAEVFDSPMIFRVDGGLYNINLYRAPSEQPIFQRDLARIIPYHKFGDLYERPETIGTISLKITGVQWHNSPYEGFDRTCELSELHPYPFELEQILQNCFQYIQDYYKNDLQRLVIRSKFMDMLLFNRAISMGRMSSGVQRLNLVYCNPIPEYVFDEYELLNERMVPSITYPNFVRLLLMNDHVHKTMVLEHPYFQSMPHWWQYRRDRPFILHASPSAEAVRDTSFMKFRLDHLRLFPHRAHETAVPQELVDPRIFWFRETFVPVGPEVDALISEFTELYRGICRNMFKDSSKILHDSLFILRYAMKNDWRMDMIALAEMDEDITTLLRSGRLGQEKVEKLKHEVCEVLAKFFLLLERNSDDTKLLQFVSHIREDLRLYEHKLRFYTDIVVPDAYDIVLRQKRTVTVLEYLTNDAPSDVRIGFARKLLTFYTNFLAWLAYTRRSDVYMMRIRSNSSDVTFFMTLDERRNLYQLRIGLSHISTIYDVLNKSKLVPIPRDQSGGIQLYWKRDIRSTYKLLGAYTMSSIIDALADDLYLISLANSVWYNIQYQERNERAISIAKPIRVQMREQQFFVYESSPNGFVPSKHEIPEYLLSMYDIVYSDDPRLVDFQYSSDMNFFLHLLVELFLRYPALYQNVWVYNHSVLDLSDELTEEWMQKMGR